MMYSHKPTLAKIPSEFQVGVLFSILSPSNVMSTISFDLNIWVWLAFMTSTKKLRFAHKQLGSRLGSVLESLWHLETTMIRCNLKQKMWLNSRLMMFIPTRHFNSLRIPKPQLDYVGILPSRLALAFNRNKCIIFNLGIFRTKPTNSLYLKLPSPRITPISCKKDKFNPMMIPTDHPRCCIPHAARSRQSTTQFAAHKALYLCLLSQRDGVFLWLGGWHNRLTTMPTTMAMKISKDASSGMAAATTMQRGKNLQTSQDEQQRRCHFCRGNIRFDCLLELSRRRKLASSKAHLMNERTESSANENTTIICQCFIITLDIRTRPKTFVPASVAII